MKIAGVVGARPNFMKIAPLMRELDNYPEEFDFVLVHTGQHYDLRMNDVFFRELGIREPDVHLGVGSDSHAAQTARIMLGLEEVLLRERPHLVLVVGDVNSTMASALVASKLGIAVAHVEAGLRSGDMRMPEEINRVVTDALSEVLFTTSRQADEHLAREGVDSSRVCLVGNIMIDTLVQFLDKAEGRSVLGELGLKPGSYGLVTLHRPSNVDDPAVLEGLAGALGEISRHLPLVFPVHPRTASRLEEHGLRSGLESHGGIRLIDPLGYLDFLCLMKSARLVLSDSGGMQEETTYLRIPCLTLRENTERPETISEGTNLLVGSDPERIVHEALEILAGRGKKGSELPFWDGLVAGRIRAELQRRKARLMLPAAERLAPGAGSG